MMPFAARQRELPGIQQQMYHSVPPTPDYRHSMQLPPTQHYQPPPANPRPLFRSHSTSSTHHPLQENLLRRKTPNGTLPAAFDATSMDWTARPTKQILLPYQTQATAQMGQRMEPPRQEYSERAGTLRLQGVDMGAMFQGIPGQGDEHQEPQVRQLLQHQQHQMLPRDQAPTWMGGQPLGFQPMYNPITPPTASCDEVNDYLMGNNYNNRAWPTQYAGWAGQQMTPALLPQAVNNMSLNNTYYHQPQDLLHANIWHNTLNASTNQLPNTTPFTNTLQPIKPELHHFHSDPSTGGQPHNRIVEAAPTRDKVAAWAHKAYVDLLTATQTARAVDQAAGHSTTSKHALYPRPPKITGIKTTSPRRAQTHYPEYASDRRKRHRPSIDLGNALHMNGNYSTPDVHVNAHARKLPVDCYSATPPLQRLSSGVTGSSQLLNGSADQNGRAVMAAKQHHATTLAQTALGVMERMCAEDGSWADGMLLCGCLAFGLGDPNKAAGWYARVLALDEGHVEAMSNIAIASLALEKRDEAEKFWRRAIELKPACFEAIEHLVGLLCGERRPAEAVDLINWVEARLRRPESDTQIKQDFNTWPQTSGFMIPAAENGRILALVHAKGNMLYTLGDNAGAAKAFEEAILVATGGQSGGIAGLINNILVVLRTALEEKQSLSPPRTPVLLPPEKAILTAQLVFQNGQLPGLREVPAGLPQTAAISTTSNSLLSLAKIFQDGMSSGGGSIGPWGAGVKDILALYYLSLALHPSPSTANNVGILLASIQASSAGSASSAPSTGPGTGIFLALQYYNYGLKLDNRHAHLYTNLGSLLKDINQLGPAIEMYEQAVKCDSNFDIALANLANAVKDQGRIRDAIKYYRRAVDANPDFAEAVCGLANALNSVCDWKGRGGVVRDSGNRDRWHVDDDGKLRDAKAVGAVSSGWMKRVVEIVEKQLRQGESWGKRVLQGEARENFVRSIEYAQGGTWTDEQHRELWHAVESWARQPYEGAKIVRMIERASQRTVWRWYHDKFIRGLNNPTDAYLRPQLPSGLTTPSAPTVLPFHTFTCPLSAEQVRLISERNGLRISCSTLRASWLPPHVYPPPSPPAPYLRVGYVSSDFNNHPLAHLMQSVFGLHDTTRVKAYCYATTASDASIHRQQIQREAPVFHEAHSWSAEKLISQIIADGIHILINLNGFTRGARNEIFAARPAPIQMSFMGFAGTLGAEWCDYLYADTTAVPEETLRPTRENVTVQDMIRANGDAEHKEWVYAENIIFARYSFFCCDHRQSAPDALLPAISWEQERHRRWQMRKTMFADLPDNFVIFANFNQLYKIEPTTFRTWLRILQAVPNSILWLLRFPDVGEANLLSLARTWSTPATAARIIFTDVAPKALHISRAQVCDLFLDTPECNAHTTAADVLWSGTPLLTLPRHKHKMCSRIAASILRAAVPQTEEGSAMAEGLVCADEAEYERRAVELAEGGVAGELERVRRGLWEERGSGGLFDTKRWVRDLEDAYEVAWRRWVRGEGGDVWLGEMVKGRG